MGRVCPTWCNCPIIGQYGRAKGVPTHRHTNCYWQKPCHTNRHKICFARAPAQLLYPTPRQTIPTHTDPYRRVLCVVGVLGNVCRGWEWFGRGQHNRVPTMPTLGRKWALSKRSHQMWVISHTPTDRSTNGRLRPKLGTVSFDTKLIRLITHKPTRVGSTYWSNGVLSRWVQPSPL